MLADLSRAGSASLNNFTCTLESHRQLLFLIRGSIMSPKICIMSEILHLKHKAQLPHIFIFGFEHNYWFPLQSYSVQVSSSNNFLDGSIVPSIILKIISDSLKSLLVLCARWDSEKFYFHIFSLSFMANPIHQFPAHINSSKRLFELSATQVPSGSLPASFPGCLSVTTALNDDINSVPPLRKGQCISSCSSSLWSSTATDVNKRGVLLESVANIPQLQQMRKYLKVSNVLISSVGKDFMFYIFHVIALKD